MGEGGLPEVTLAPNETVEGKRGSVFVFHTDE